MLRPQDLLVLLRLALILEGDRITFQALSVELGMSASEVHGAVSRSKEVALIIGAKDGNVVNHKNLAEFVIHGVRYVFPAKRGGLTRGIPTSHAAPPLSRIFAKDELPPVWPHPEGNTRGEALSPIYRSAPGAALKNQELYENLALVDAIRAGRARERALAAKEFSERLRA